MTKTVEELMEATLSVFAERNDAKRRALIADTYSEDVAFTDADGTVNGRDELNSKVGGLLDGVPDAQFRARGPLRVSAELGYLPWSFGPEGAQPFATGMDIGIVENGVITRLHTFLEEGPAAS